MEHKLRLLFLREFTKHLIINSIPEEEMERLKHQPLVQHPNIPIYSTMEASPKIKFQQSVLPQRTRVSLPEGPFQMKELNLFLSDPRVQHIECNGPDQEILVNVSGKLQKTNTKLTREQIESLIKDFSEKTRIPLVKGVFKAAFGNIILTAVISDFVGTRFTIQKKGPTLNRIT